MANGLSRLATRFWGRDDDLARARSLVGKDLVAADAAAAGLVTSTPDDLDWDDEVRLLLEERASFSPDALTGMEANLRFPGPETMETKIFARLTAWQNWIFQRPTRSGRTARCRSYGTGSRPDLRQGARLMSARSTSPPASPTTSAWPTTGGSSGRWRAGCPATSTGGASSVRPSTRTTRSSCARRRPWGRRAGPTSTTCACRTTAGASSWPSPSADRRIAFGDRRGEPVWQDVPGEHRSELRRLLVVQGDTEPASVEQQRHLCRTAPSLYDMRNLFQVNVEEGRHLWAMVYLLHRYFGRDGRDEADELLERHSGDVDNPRILGAFNEPTPDWLSFYFFTYFTDRDGKFQLASLRESAFDPLSRTCDFMLKEEAHHMFVGATGVGRVVQRTAELMKEHDTDDIRPHGGIDVATLQRYLNFHFSVSLDLFGAETSTNAANYFAAGPQGAVPGGAPVRRPPAARRRPHCPDRRRRPDRRARGRRRSPRSTRRCATTTSPTAPRASIAGTGRWRRSAPSCGCPTSASTGRSARSRDHRVSPGRPARDAPTEWDAGVGGLAADAGRRGVRRLAHAAGHGAGEDGGLGRAAVERHQRQAARLRVRRGRDGTVTYNAAAWLVDRHVDEGRGDHLAVVCGDHQLSYADLQRQVWRAQNALPRWASGARSASCW